MEPITPHHSHNGRPHEMSGTSNGHPASNGHDSGVDEILDRHNGLAPAAPDPDQRILVAGGAGYIGSILVPRLLKRGYRVRVLDRLYFGEDSLAAVRDDIELVAADVRDIPSSAFDGIDGVINLSGLSNDPTAEFNPEANWQMNAIATETLGRECVSRGIERYVFASSCSLYDGLPPGMHSEAAPVQPRAAYATSKRYGEERLLELADRRALPRYSAQWNRVRLESTDALRSRGQHVCEGCASGWRAEAPRWRLDVASVGGHPGLRRRDDRVLRGTGSQGER